MSAEKVMYALLSADAALVALVGTRIYPSPLPQEIVLPAITYTLISDLEQYTLDAASPYALRRARVQVDVFASDYAQQKSCAAAVSKAVRYKRGSIAGVPVVSVLESNVWSDDRDDLRGVWMQAIDFAVTYTEPRP